MCGGRLAHQTDRRADRQGEVSGAAGSCKTEELSGLPTVCQFGEEAGGQVGRGSLAGLSGEHVKWGRRARGKNARKAWGGTIKAQAHPAMGYLALQAQGKEGKEEWGRLAGAEAEQQLPATAVTAAVQLSLLPAFS